MLCGLRSTTTSPFHSGFAGNPTIYESTHLSQVRVRCALHAGGLQSASRGFDMSPALTRRFALRTHPLHESSRLLLYCCCAFRHATGMYHCRSAMCVVEYAPFTQLSLGAIRKPDGSGSALTRYDKSFTHHSLACLSSSRL